MGVGGGLEELRGGGVLLWVSPTAGTSVLLCAPAGKAVRLGCRALLPRRWGRPVGGGPVGFRRRVRLHLVFLLFLLPSPEGPAAERIYKRKKTCHTTAHLKHVRH